MLSGKSRGTVLSPSQSTGHVWITQVWLRCVIAVNSSKFLTVVSSTNWDGRGLSWENCPRWDCRRGTLAWWASNFYCVAVLLLFRTIFYPDLNNRCYLKSDTKSNLRGQIVIRVFGCFYVLRFMIKKLTWAFKQNILICSTCRFVCLISDHVISNLIISD